MDNLQYSELKRQDYLMDNKVPSYKAKRAFMYRVRMARVKANFKQSYADLNCALGCPAEDRQEHLLKCDKIKENSELIRLNKTAQYEDIFSSSIEKLVAAVDLLDVAMKVREKLLDTE